MIEFPNGRRAIFCESPGERFTSKSERDIAADKWHVADTPYPFKRKHKKNSRSVLTGRKQTKIVRPGDSC